MGRPGGVAAARSASSSARELAAAAASDPACASMSADGSPRRPRAARARCRCAARLGLDVGHLVPGERARHAGVGGRRGPSRPRRPCGRGRSGCSRGRRPWRSFFHHLLVAQPGCPALDLAGDGERRSAHVDEAVLGVDPHVDVDPARAARSWGSRSGRAPRAARGRVIATVRTSANGTPGVGSRSIRSSSGWSRSAAPHRPRVEVDHPEVDRPGEVRGVVCHQLLGASRRWGSGRRPSAATPARPSARASGRRTCRRRRRRSASAWSAARAGGCTTGSATAT